MIIDVHNHWLPEEMARQLGARPGKSVMIMEGDIPKRKIHDPLFMVERRLQAMEEAGIDRQVVSCTAGWNAPVDKCRMVNDHLAGLQKLYPGRLVGLADVPLGVGSGDKEVIKELHRALDELGLAGVSLPAQPCGIPLDDERFRSFYREVESLQAGVFIHPSPVPSGFDALARYDLHRIVGREFDLVAAVCRVMLGGVMDAFPKLKLLFSHQGGGIAALLERIEPRVKAGRHALPREAADYMKMLYFDTAGFSGGMQAFRLACEVLGPSQLLFATDYPQDLVSGREIKDYIERIKTSLPEGDVEMIMSKNAVKLFRLPS